MSGKTYLESFDDGPGGWFGWKNNFEGPKALEVCNGSVISRSPWWIDYNHAPPGAGYLHMLYCLLTAGSMAYSEQFLEIAGTNRFIEGNYPTNFAWARLVFRLRGELRTNGTQLLLLIQGSVNGLTSGWVMKGRPLQVTTQWSEQEVILDPDPELWSCLGSRHDRVKTYGQIELATILHNVNADIMLVLFPLEVAPMGPLSGDPHKLRAGLDYPVWQSRLPEGYTSLDEVRIEFRQPPVGAAMHPGTKSQLKRT